MFLAAALLLAQTAPACPAMNASLPPPLAAWTLVPAGELAVGKAIMRPTLARSAVIPALPAGGKPGRAMTAGFTVETAGIYGIALDQPGWIDVVPGGQTAALTSMVHGHGPQCSSIRKIVRYRFEPGFYRVNVTGLSVAMVKLMVVAGE